jgi:hypothetical protein
VTDLETELREAMRATTASARPPRDLMEQLRRRRRRHRTRRVTISAAAAAVMVAAVPASLILLGGGGRPAAGAGSATPSAPASATQAPQGSQSEQPPPPRGWSRHRDGAGDYIDTPAAWHSSSRAALVEPDVRWVIGTGPVRSGGGCAPTAALRQMPADGALFQVIEYGSTTSPYDFRPRRGRLGLGPVGGPMECWGVKTHLIMFQDGGRYFQVQTVFGAKAPSWLHAKVTRSLNTLHIAPLPAGEQTAALCQAGQWTYCPQAAWVNQVLRQAHVINLGNQATRAIFGGTGQRSFALWTTPRDGGPPGSRCHSVSGTKVCRAGNRLVWSVHGLLLWLQPALSPYSTPPIRPGLPTSRALRRLVKAARAVRTR